MSRIAPKLLTALFVLGCGSGAMASPIRGQWTDNSGGDQTQAPQGYPGQGGYTSQSSPSQGGYATQGGYQSPSGYSSQGSSAQGSSPQGFPAQSYPPQSYPDQGSAQPLDQDQDEDFAETEPVESQGRLGIMVLSLTPELRRFFGVASDRGVLVARVEPNSAAARAGIQVGDVLVRVGPQVVHAGEDVVQSLAARQGSRVRVAVVRQGRPIHLVAIVSTGMNNQMNNQGPMNNQNPQGPQGPMNNQNLQGPQGPMNNGPINQGPPNQSNQPINQSNLPNSSSQQNQL